MISMKFRIQAVCLLLGLTLHTCGAKPWHLRRKVYLAAHAVSAPTPQAAHVTPRDATRVLGPNRLG